MLAVISRSVIHEHLSGKRNNSLPLIFVKICQCEVYFRARLDDSSVSARCCVCSAWTKSPASVIVAWGESGAAGQVSGGEVVDSAACPPPAVVDTLGAGDTFLAATIVCLSQGYDLRQSIAAGCRVAGVKVGASGFSAVHPQLIQLPMNS
ncbi:hypothetical protein J6590_052877 [Homalodisca vitripennis]|nr:hypothetical protein J6590_052877 [Homalodisca vitripennis]